MPSDEVWKQFVGHVILNEDARTKAMILLAYDAALRREELMSLRVADIDWAHGLVTVRAETTKGGRMRYVPVSACVLHLLRDYLEGDRRALIAAYDGDDTGPFSCQNPPVILAARSPLVRSTKSSNGCGRRLACQRSLLTPCAINAARF